MDRSYVRCLLIYWGCLLVKNSFVNISEVNRQCLHSLGTRSEVDFEKVSIFIGQVQAKATNGISRISAHWDHRWHRLRPQGADVQELPWDDHPGQQTCCKDLFLSRREGGVQRWLAGS